MFDNVSPERERLLKLYLWIMGALHSLEKQGLIHSAHALTPKGLALFDQVERELDIRPTDEELDSWSHSIQTPSEQDREGLVFLLRAVRDGELPIIP